MYLNFQNAIKEDGKMALISQARIATNQNRIQRLGCLFSGRSKEIPTVIRSFATTLQRKGGGVDSWTYRRQNPRPPKYIEYMSTGVMTLVYWWMFWHIFTEPGHLFGGSRFGEFDFPCPEDWTDEELGIPPDDYEE